MGTFAPVVGRFFVSQRVVTKSCVNVLFQPTHTLLVDFLVDFFASTTASTVHILRNAQKEKSIDNRLIINISLARWNRLPRYEPHKVALRSVIVDVGSQTKQKPLLAKQGLLCHKARVRTSTNGLYNTKASNLSIEGFCFV